MDLWKKARLLTQGSGRRIQLSWHDERPAFGGLPGDRRWAGWQGVELGAASMAGRAFSFLSGPRHLGVRLGSGLYANRRRDYEEVLPWSHIVPGDKGFCAGHGRP